MKIPVGNRISAFQSAVKPRQVRTVSVSKGQNGSAAARFDKVTISGSDNERSSFEMQLKGKISQDVRAATTTGMLASLQQQISEGKYQPDTTAIAHKMLFFEEA